MQSTRERGTPHKRWRDGFEEDLHVTGINNRQAIARDHWEWMKIVLEIKVHNRLWCFLRSRRRIVIHAVFSSHVILSPVLCTVPVNPNFIHKTHL
jgi:hypothetical protein